MSGVPGTDYAIGAGYQAAGGRDAYVGYGDRRGDYGMDDRGRYGHEYAAGPQVHRGYSILQTVPLDSR